MKLKGKIIITLFAVLLLSALIALVPNCVNEAYAEEECTHDYGTFIDEVPSTCKTKGTKGHYQCSICNAYFDADYVPITDLSLSLNRTNHELGEKSDYSYYDGYHWKEYACCDEMVPGTKDNCVVDYHNSTWDDETHSFSCTICKNVVFTYNHSFFKDCSTKCEDDNCGYVRKPVVEHTLYYEHIEEGGHRPRCRVCSTYPEGYEYQPHSLEREPINNENRWHMLKCSICTYKKTEVHTYEWKSDDVYHWNECTNCEYIDLKGEHTFETNTCFDTCENSNCNYKLSIKNHIPSSSWTVRDDTGHTKKCLCGETIISSGAHTPEIVFEDDNFHITQCSICEYPLSDSEEHIYDDDDDRTCSKCGYVRDIEVKKVIFKLSGYELGAAIDQITVTAEGNGLTINDGYVSGYLISTDMEQIENGVIYPNQGSVFLPNVRYYLMIAVNALDGYSLDFLYDSTLEGVGRPLSLNNSREIAVHYFALPVIGGKPLTKVPELSFSFADLSLGGDMSGGITQGENNSNYISIKTCTACCYYGYELIPCSPNETIDLDIQYAFFIQCRANSGYTFFGFTKDDVTVSDNVSIDYVDVWANGDIVSIFVLYEPLSNEHEHVYDYSSSGDSPYHSAYCTICSKHITEEHTLSGNYCEVCDDYITMLIDVEFSISGYEVDADVSNLTLTMSDDSYGIYWDNTLTYEDEIYCILSDSDISYESILRPGIKFYPGIEYYICIEVFEENYYYYLLNESGELGITFNIEGVEFFEMQDCLAIFKLPKLTGESTQVNPSGEFSISTYSIGGDFESAELQSVSSTGISYAAPSYFEGYLEGETTFAAERKYYVEIGLVAADGYTFCGLSADSIKLHGVAAEDIVVYSGGSIVFLSYYLPVLGEHTTHTYDSEYEHDDQQHWHLCSVCSVPSEKETHDFEEVDGRLRCIDCFYVIPTAIFDVEFTLTGYKTNAFYDDMELTDKAGLITVTDSFIRTNDTFIPEYYYDIVDTVDSGTQYYLYVFFTCPDYYIFVDLDKDDISIDKIGTAIDLLFVKEYGDDYCIAIFKLPVLGVNHIHGGELNSLISASCAEEGQLEHYTCSVCGKYFDAENNQLDSISIPASHEFGEWVDENPASCIKTGTKGHKDCSICGKHFDANGEIIDNLDIPKTEHVFGSLSIEIPSDCKNTGTKAHKDCSVCGKHFDADDNEIKDITIPVDSSAHSFGQLDEGSPVGCDYPGVIEHKDCTICGKHFTKQGTEIDNVEIPPLGHMPFEIPAKEPTCTKKGNIKYYDCINCYKYFTSETAEKEIAWADIELKANGHDYGEISYKWNDKTECIATRSCTRNCGEEGHTQTDSATITPTIIQDQNCENPELTNFTAVFSEDWCVTQTLTNVETKSAKGHNDNDKDHACDDCSKEVGEHKGQSNSHDCAYCGKNASNCVDENKDHACDICSETMGEHKGQSDSHDCAYCGKNASDCVDENKDHACDICSETLGEHKGQSDSHDCAYCGKNASDCVDENKDHACDICSETMGEHKGQSNSHDCAYCGNNASDCIDENKDHACDICSETMGEHKGQSNSHDCAYCGKNASEHSGGSATCIDKPTCSVCGEKYGSALGHKFGELSNEVPATCTESGVKAHKDCSVCGKHFDADGVEITDLAISPKGHKLVKVDAKLSTVEENGNIEYYRCDECNKLFKDALAKEELELSSTILPKLDLVIEKVDDSNVDIAKDGLSFKANGNISAEEIKVNGEVVDSSNYTVTEDNMIVLKPDYIASLGNGEHVLSIGEASTEFKVDFVNEGLSGGAIAGIVIASVLVVALGGFAIFWFVIKKKSFADIVAIFKK